VPGLVDRVDDYQRKHRWVGMPIGVLYKFFDDQGGYLAAVLTYYAFVSIFPILLIASAVLGFVLQGQPALQQDILNSTLAQFPIVGDQLGRPEGIQGSTSAVVVGSLTALYGIIGLGQAAQNTVNVTWGIPRNSRLNPVVSRLRGAAWLVLAGLSLVIVATLSSLGSNLEIFGGDPGGAVKWLALAATVVLTTGVLIVMLQLSTPHRERYRELLPGAILIAVGWQALQFGGNAYVEHVIKKASSMNAVFAVVLGLMALIYIGTVIAMIGLELNVVLAKRLYPRALLTPFTDNVLLTQADEQVYRDYAKAQRHKGFERITVTFEDEPDE
jgi:membrane protein